MKILCTGSSGFIGREFVTQARAAGHEVCPLPRWEWMDYQAMLAFHWSAWDALVHLAAAGVKRPNRNWPDCMEVNFHALRRLLLSVKAKPTVFLACSIREADLAHDHTLWGDAYYVSKKLGGDFARAWAKQYEGRVIMPTISACYTPGRVQVVASLILRDIAAP